VTGWNRCFRDAEQRNGAPGFEAVRSRVARIDKALLSHLTGAFRGLVCPKNLTIAAAGTDLPTEQLQVGMSWRRLGLESSDSVSYDGSPSQVNEVALRHCLRGFVVLGRGDEAEKLVSRLVMLPFIDLNFTQVSASVLQAGPSRSWL
jgi:hypothetical protein